MLENARYDVILGTPWRNDVKPRAKYDEGIVKITNLIIKGKVVHLKGAKCVM